jgi:hypothetical protein
LKSATPLLCLILLLSSCDCVQDVYGTVLDADNHQPIDSVYVYKKNRESHYSYTDTNGHFEVESISGGLTFGCPPMTVELKKAGYEMSTTEIKVGSHVKIYMRKINK